MIVYRASSCAVCRSVITLAGIVAGLDCVFAVVAVAVVAADIGYGLVFVAFLRLKCANEEVGDKM